MTSSDPDWHTDEFPELRPRPPWVMEEMMASQPGLAVDLIDDPAPAIGALAATLRRVLADGAPVTVCGCGTSEHAGAGIAAQLRAAAGPAHAAQIAAVPAFTAALEPRRGLCIGISHEGGTRATALALEAAHATGALTAAVTAAPQSEVAAAAETLIVTPSPDRSWCHTVAYTSAILAGAALAAELGSFRTDGRVAASLLDMSVADPAARIARVIAGSRTILCAGVGVDCISAREQALKIAEGARIPALALELETVLHGCLAAHDTRDALIIFGLAGATGPDRAARRAEHLARAADLIGLRVAAVLNERVDARLEAGLTTAGRIVIDAPDAAPDTGVTPELRALLGGAVALQRLTLELAHVRGTNPDLIRREEAPYRAAAEAAEGATDW